MPMGRFYIGSCGKIMAICYCALIFYSCTARYSGDTIVLRVANWGGPAGDPVFMKMEQEIKEQFEQQQPQVKIQLENIPGPGQYVPKLLMTFLADNPPDVITLDAASAAVFVNHQLLADLMPFVQADKDFRTDDYEPNVLAIAQKDNGLYAIPLDFTPMVILFNKRLFDDAKVSYPQPGWTREEFLEAAKTLTLHSSNQESRYGFTFNTSMAMWLPWVWAAGGDVLDPDGRHAAGYLDSPATVETIQFLIDLILKYQVTPRLSESAASGMDLFRAQKAAMTMTGHWSLIEYKADQMSIGVAGIPGKEGKRATIMYAAGLAIARASRQKEAAWAYIKHMTGENVQRRRVATGLAVSANMRVSELMAQDPVEASFLNEVRYARPPWGSRVERYERVEELGREMMEDMINGKLPVRETAARTAALIESELKNQ